MRLKKTPIFIAISTLLLMLAMPFIIPDFGPILTGPIQPDYEEEPNQGSNANDKYLLAPHIAYVGNNTDQFPTGEDITYSAHALICIDGEFQEALDGVSGGFVLDCDFHTSQFYTPDEIEWMHIGFVCRLIDMTEGTILWTWGGNLKMKEASVFWDNDDLYAKHYNTVDEDGFSMTVYLMNYDPSGVGAVNPDPVVDEETQRLQILLFIGLLCGVTAIYTVSTKRRKQQQQPSHRKYYSPITLSDYDIPEPEPTEEELEEIRLEGIRKESRLKTLEELIQNVTAIKSPQHVLDNTELSIEEFEPEDEREELAFGVLCNLHEEAKEKMRRDAIEEDR